MKLKSSLNHITNTTGALGSCSPGQSFENL